MLVLRFLLPVPVGLTDNGDGWRLTCQVGAFDGGRASMPYVQFFYHGLGDCGRVEYVSSQVWIARVAQWVGHLIGTDSVLNLLLVGLVCCVLAAAGVTAVVLGLRLRFRYRVLAGALVLLLLADSAFFGYFASVVTEGPAFLGAVLSVGGLLLMHRTGAWRYTGAAVVLFGGLILVNAKLQTLFVLPVLVLAVLLVRRVGRTWLARWALPLSVCAALTGVSGYVWGTGNISDLGATAQMNSYHVVFDSILDGRHDTAADLADLGLPQSFARYIGTTVWSANGARTDPLYPLYEDRFTRSNLMHYYLTHPVRTIQILDRAATDMFLTRADYQGSYAEEAGHPPVTKEYRVPVISGLMHLVAPLGLALLLPVWLLLGWAVVRLWRTGRREFAVVVLFALGIAVSQFLQAALAEGIENVKHQVIAAFCLALGCLLVLFGAFARRAVPADEPEPEPAEVAPDVEPVAVTP